MFRRAGYIFIVILAANAALWFFTALRFVVYQYSLDFGEGILLSQSMMLAHGENIYPAINDYPYIVSNYHPLYPFLSGLPFTFMNPALWTGRLLTLLSAIGSMTIIGLIVGKTTKRIELGAISALLPLCLSYSYNWAFVYRVDYLGVFLSLLGLYLYMFPPKKGGIYWSILPFSLAFLTKISFLLAPIACLIDLAMRRKKSLSKYFVFSLLAAGIPYLVLNLVTDFGMFRDTIIYTANAFHISRMLDGFREILQYTLPLWLLMIIGVARGDGKFRVLIFSYLFLILVSLITYGAEGSDSNYFIELIYVLSAAALMWFPEFIKQETGNEKGFDYRWLAVALILVFCIQGRIMDSDQFGFAGNLRKLAESQQVVDKFVANTQGDVISEDATFLAKNGKRMVFQPYIMSLLARNGKWDQSRFVDDLKKGRFNLVVLRFDVNDPKNTDKPGEYGDAGFDRFTDEMENAIKEGYREPVCANPQSGNRWFLYLPRNGDNKDLKNNQE